MAMLTRACHLALATQLFTYGSDEPRSFALCAIVWLSDDDSASATTSLIARLYMDLRFPWPGLLQDLERLCKRGCRTST